MKLIHRNRQAHRDRAPRVTFSEAEITADLLYPAARREVDPVKRRPPRR